MEIEHGKIEGNYNINCDFTLYGMITGNAYIKDGGRLELKGMICQNLTIEEGGELTLNGMVCGNVINKGGKIAVYGMILGSLSSFAGETYVDPKASIGTKSMT